MPQLPLIETQAKHKPTVPRPRPQTSNVDLVRDYNSESDGDDECRDSIEGRKPSSSSYSMGPPGLSASAVRSNQGVFGRGTKIMVSRGFSV